MFRTSWVSDRGFELSTFMTSEDRHPTAQIPHHQTCSHQVEQRKITRLASHEVEGFGFGVDHDDDDDDSRDHYHWWTIKKAILGARRLPVSWRTRGTRGTREPHIEMIPSKWFQYHKRLNYSSISRGTTIKCRSGYIWLWFRHIAR